VIHGADYDVVCLKRSLGITVRGLFDTMIAAQFLGTAKFGLADLVAEHFGEVLEKKHTRTDWARRPLTESELDYAHLDVKRLIPLAAILERRLAEADILEETVMEFRRLEEREPAEREFDEDGYLRIAGCRDLDDPGRAILRELFLFRDREARRADRPPFRILVNETMLRLAEARPFTEAALAGVRGVSAFLLKRFGPALLKAVERGLARGAPPAPHQREPRRPRMSPRQQRALERLREWRKVEGARRGRLPIVVLPNPALLEVVHAGPRDLAALAAVPGVGEKRARLYGADILAILDARN
jgi:ribonuclease D